MRSTALLSVAPLLAVACSQPGYILGSGPSFDPPSRKEPLDSGSSARPDTGAGSARDAGSSVTPPPPPPSGVDAGACVGAGDERAATHIYYGTTEPTVVELSAGQKLAIGQVDLGGGLCSGLLIAPRWVLTARHCTESASASSTVFKVGAEPGNPNIEIRVSSFVDNPSADMALLELERDATEVAPGIVPVRIINEETTNAWVGRTVEASGYGQTEEGTTGSRKFSAEPIVSIDGQDVTIDGEGRHGVCFGDSGGPLLARATDGSVRVIGDLSNGDGSCVGQDHYTRVDLQRAWIERSTGPTPGTDPGPGPGPDAGPVPRPDAGPGPVPDPCAGLDLRGRCDGAVARWCQGGRLMRRDCAVCGQGCGAMPNGDSYCLETPPSTPPPSGGGDCGGLDYLGRCDGNTAVWCESGTVRRLDCAGRGQICGYVDGSVGYYCR